PCFADILGTADLETNTYHHQAVTPATLAPELRAFAVSPVDGLIEALWHPDRPILAVQWHPERPTPSAPQDEILVRGLLDGVFWR
ncbi:MAG: hypothetical protein GYB65_01925, partial [Chloroflexi bacterium]|nr:hypothetical protein [Chloroflexota bacterium]